MPKTLLVQNEKNGESMKKCEIYLKNCTKISLSRENLANLLEGELVLGGEEYQYIGKDLDLKTKDD